MKNSKIIFPLLCSLVSIASLAQSRYIDAYVSFASPEQGTEITSPHQLDITLQVINKGPDSLLATDTFAYGLSHYFLDSFKWIKIPINWVISPEDTLWVHHSFDIDIKHDFDEFPISFKGGVVGFYSAVGAERRIRPELFEDQWDNYPTLVLKHKKNASIHEPHPSSVFRIYPNPLTQANLHINGPIREVQLLRVISPNGKIVYAQTKLTDHQITLPQLAPGLYTVALQTKKGSYHHWKILHVE